MKKINRKGFTLIELLAVIIILGIVMVLTIPSVIDSMNNAKYKQLQNAANKVADWLLEQYTLYQMDSSSVDSKAKSMIIYNGSFRTGDINNNVTLAYTYMELSGLSDVNSNFNESSGSGSTLTRFSIYFYNADKGKFCVKLQAKSGGQFFNNLDNNKNVAFSSGCPVKKPTGDDDWTKYNPTS